MKIRNLYKWKKLKLFETTGIAQIKELFLNYSPKFKEKFSLLYPVYFVFCFPHHKLNENFY